MQNIPRRFFTATVGDLSKSGSCSPASGDDGQISSSSPTNLLSRFLSRFRSRRKGAELAGGGGAQQQRTTTAAAHGQQNAATAGGNGNGVCPAPDTAAGHHQQQSACTSANQSNKKTGVISFSQAGSAKSGKAVQSVDTCVADSFDEQMIDKMCALPKGLDRNEWLATQILALFEHVNCIAATLSEVCTPVTCSIMSFPGNMKAAWVDERGKRHNYSAMRYIDSVMSLCEASRKNQALFPTKYGSTFCPDFSEHCARMVRLLWHCCGHIYTKHGDHLATLNLRPQFGLVLAHLAKMAKLYALLPDKELASLVSTLQLARPAAAAAAPTTAVLQHRPSKRALLLDNSNTTISSNNNDKTGTYKMVQKSLEQQQQNKKKHKENNNNNAKTEQKHPQHNNNNSSNFAAMLAMNKSGSWGGHSALSAAESCGGADDQLLGPNCQKCYAQTC